MAENDVRINAIPFESFCRMHVAYLRVCSFKARALLMRRTLNVTCSERKLHIHSFIII